MGIIVWGLCMGYMGGTSVVQNTLEMKKLHIHSNPKPLTLTSALPTKNWAPSLKMMACTAIPSDFGCSS